MEKREIERILKQNIDASFSLGRELGRGGNAVVYELEGMEQEAVLKVVFVDAILEKIGGAARDFYYQRLVSYQRKEIELLKAMNDCEYVADLLDAYEIATRDSSKTNLFFMIEKKYQCLDDFMKTQYLTEGLLVQMAKDILKALVCMEERKILHRDIKPANIFIRWQAGKPCFVLGDFGLAKKVEQKYGQVTPMGTPAFAAPEISKGENIQGFNSDIFGLGASLFYILSEGCVPHMYFQAHKKPVLKQGSREFRRIILKAMAYDPKDRYAHAADMLEDLEHMDYVHTAPVIFNKYAYLAKKALLEGKTEKAMKYASEGIESGIDHKGGMSREAMACLRIRIYIRMCINKDHNSIEEEECLILKELAESGDAVAQYLYGLSLFDSQKEKEGLAYFKRSAENGSAIGGYAYGRMLCQGFRGILADMEKGIHYLEIAAGKGYIPAVRYLKRIQRKYPDLYIPDAKIAELLLQDTSDYENNKIMYIIPYL